MHIGTDICNPKRVEKIYQQFGAKFVKRLLTADEIKDLEEGLTNHHGNFIHRLAGRFAAKEAIAKLLQTGIGKELSFQDIEILRGKKGEPTVKLNEKAQKLSKKLKISEIKLSISHEDIMVMATAIAN